MSLGLTHTELGRPLGITTRQGLRDRLDRLDALLAYDRPDEQLVRDTRREARRSDPRQAWLDAHKDYVHRVLANLLDQAEQFAAVESTSGPDQRHDAAYTADEQDWLAELRADITDHNVTPATVSILGLVLGPLRITAHEADLAGSHGLPRAIRACDALRADLARAPG
jgi:hypothetical protein